MVTVVYTENDPNLIGFSAHISYEMVSDGFVFPIAIDSIQTELIKTGRHWDSKTFLINESSNPVTLFHWRVIQSNIK